MSRYGPQLSLIAKRPVLAIADSATNLVTNPGFETSGSPFGTWTTDENKGTATITRTTTSGEYRSGSAACKMVTNVSGNSDAHVYQDITVAANTGYHLTFWSKIEDIFASMQGRYAIYDNSNADWIISREKAWGVSSTSWQQTSRIFGTPNGCTSIRVYLYQNIDSNDEIGSYVLYDDVSLVARLRSPSTVIYNLPASLEFASYTHSISMDGYYDTMSVSFPATEAVFKDWIENGLFRFVDVIDGEGYYVWGGFVDEISIQYGPTTISIGPVMDIVNRTRLKYRTLDFNTTPPVKGDDMKSVWLNHVESQARYGVLEGVSSGGEDTVDNMNQLLNVLSGHQAWPFVSNNLAFGGGSIQITVNCKGRIHLMSKYFYYQTGIAGEYNLSSKILDLLTADPNFLTNPNRARITTNTTQVGVYEDDDKTARAILDELVDRGDSDYNGYIYGFDKDGIFFYEKEPTNISYLRDVETGEIAKVNGDPVPPHRILPGRWLRQVGDVVWNDDRGIPLQRNPSDVLIANVTYTTPTTLTITESKTSTVTRRLQAMGVSS